MDVVIRNFQEEDLPKVFDFYELDDLLPPDSYKFEPYAKDEFRKSIIEEGPFGEEFDPAGFFLAFEGDSLVAAARAHIGFQNSEEVKEKVGFIAPEWPWTPIGLAVHPEYRRKGIGTKILEKCLQYLREKGAKWAQTSTDNKCISRVRFLSKFAFKPWGKQIVFMRRDLHKPLSEIVLPEGYSFRQFKTGEENELIECDNRIFRDEWLYMPRTIDGFVNFYEKNPSFDSTGFYDIIHKDKIVGFVWNLIPKDYIQHTCRKAGLLEVLGVTREHRRRGLGTALVSRSLAWHKQKGMGSVELNTHSDAAIHFYEKCGFIIISRWKTVRMPI